MGVVGAAVAAKAQLGVDLVAASGGSAAESVEGRVYNWLLVGGGITGIYGLASFPAEERAGVLLIEQQQRVGGLWAWLPRWQTIQNDPIDFCTEGFTTDKTVWTSEDVCHMLEMKVKMHGLAPHMRLGHKLVGYEWSEKDGHWVVEVLRLADGATLDVRANVIVLGMGKHARPNIPDIPTDGSVEILHSSQLPDFSVVEGKRVAVVGAGASSLDLCVNAIKSGARGQVEWIFRENKYFSGIRLNTLWPLVYCQLLYGCAAAAPMLNVAINFAILMRHFFAGTLSWLPSYWFDVRRMQLVPGRGFLLRNKHRVRRQQGDEVAKVEGGALHLKSGGVVEGVDYLLLGTGYDLPERPKGFEKPKNFAGFASTGKFRGRLYLLGEDILDTTGATPFVAYELCRAWRTLAADAAKSSALAEERKWPEQEGRLLNQMEPLMAAAPLLREQLCPWAVWRIRMLACYMWHRLVWGTTVLWGDTVIRLGMNLDEMEGAVDPRAAAPAASPTVFLYALMPAAVAPPPIKAPPRAFNIPHHLCALGLDSTRRADPQCGGATRVPPPQQSRAEECAARAPGTNRARTVHRWSVAAAATDFCRIPYGGGGCAAAYPSLLGPGAYRGGLG